MICVFCEGNKTVHANINTGPSKAHYWRTLPCPVCDGDGELSDEKVAAIEQGKQARRDRITRGEKLHDAAERLGITVPQLSSMECGRTLGH